MIRISAHVFICYYSSFHGDKKSVSPENDHFSLKLYILTSIRQTVLNDNFLEIITRYDKSEEHASFLTSSNLLFQC